MTVGGWQVICEDGNGNAVGELADFAIDQMEPTVNTAFPIPLNIAIEDCPAGWPAHDARVVLLKDGQFVCSGSRELLTLAQGRAAAGVTQIDPSGFGAYKPVTFVSDIGWLTGRLIYPDPTRTWNNQTSTAYYTDTGTPEQVMRNLVNTQAGPGAIPSRQVNNLRLGPSAGIGGSYTLQARFGRVASRLRQIATVSGGLIFDVADDQQGHLNFTVRQPRDLTANISIGVELGTALSLTLQSTRPTCTAALVAGAGSGTARAFYEFDDPNADPADGRWEEFVDQRNSTSLADITQAGRQAYVDGGRQTAIALDIDDTIVSFGRDFLQGDLITCTAAGVDYPLTVQQCAISVSPQGVQKVSATVGSTQAAVDDPWRRQERMIERNFTNLQNI